MPLTAFALIITAAILHVGWNLIVKQVKEKYLFTWWTLIVGSLFYLPILLRETQIPTQIWPYAIISALAETAYFIALIRAYEYGDFSLVYPIARGVAPLLLVVWTVLFLGEGLELAGLGGLTLLLIGLVVVASGQWWSQRTKAALSYAAIASAFSVALCISIYSTIDGLAVRIMAPAAYTVLVLGLTGVFITPVVVSRFGWRAIITEWRERRFRIMAVGVVHLFTYILVLQAYAIARVTYASALREVSVVLAALAGWRLLGEEFGVMRIIGATLVFLGILVITIAG